MSRDDVDAVGRALEALFRLHGSRKVHDRQASAAAVTISRPGFVLLRRIQEDGPVSLGELARLTEMDPAATGRQVRRLELDGLVTRGAGPDDGRVVSVRATARGREVSRRVGEVMHQHMEDVLGTWSDADRAALADLLSRLVRDLRSVHYRTVAGERTA